MENANKSILLRPFSKNDEQRYFEISRSNEVKEYFPYYSESLKEACEIVRIFSNGDFANNFYFAIEETKDDVIIGTIIAEKITENDYNIGYFISQEYQNKGYATFALKQLIEYLKQRGAKSIRFSISRSNLASIGVANKVSAMKVSENEKYQVWQKQI